MTNKDMLLPTGVFGLDTVLGGGLSRPSLVAIIGAPGAGKTVLASQILFHAARRGLKTIIFTSFSEGVEQYIQLGLTQLRACAPFQPAGSHEGRCSCCSETAGWLDE